MGDELANLDGINELLSAGLAAPGLDTGDKWATSKTRR